MGNCVIPAIVDPDDGELVKRAVRNALPALRAGEGVVVALGQDRVEAVTPIDRDAGIYLYNARNSDALALNQWQRAQIVLAAYDALTGQAPRAGSCSSTSPCSRSRSRSSGSPCGSPCDLPIGRCIR